MTDTNIRNALAKLESPEFRAKAPDSVVQKIRDNLVRAGIPLHRQPA